MLVDHAKVSLLWLVRLRWGVLGGQLGAVLIAYEFLGVDLRFGRIAFLLGLTAATNTLLLLRLGSSGSLTRGLCGAVLVFDTLVLTAVLHATGG
jgi:two-component system sensor histidine kinase RegB